jgi:hypothetical protein
VLDKWPVTSSFEKVVGFGSGAVIGVVVFWLWVLCLGSLAVVGLCLLALLPAYLDWRCGALALPLCEGHSGLVPV